MKKIIPLSLLLFLLSFNLKGQTNAIDSLKQLLKTETKDTSRIFLFNEVAKVALYVRPDTALVYGQQGLTLARKIGYKYGEAISLNRVGNAFTATGNYPKALELHLASLKMAELVNDEKILAIALGNIGTDYSSLGNYHQSIHYTLNAMAINQRLGAGPGMASALINLGDSYEKLNVLDSASYYTNQAHQLAIKLKDIDVIGIALNNLANIYSKTGQHPLAMINYKMAVANYLQEDDESGLTEAYLGMAKLFREAGKADSSLFYAKLSMVAAKKGGLTKSVMEASDFLTEYYISIHRIDSAFVYQSATIAAKDTLFGEERQREIQSLSYDENIRQQQILEAKEQAQTQVKFNILIGGLTTLLIVSLLLYRNNRHKQKANRLLQRQKNEIEVQRDRTNTLLEELQQAQKQLIHSEKMASLGELTAGIAHEIQNPLNFVNNFSEVNKELLLEMKEEMSKGNVADANELVNDVIANEEKINYHGRRADSIVKGMLQHSRSGSVVKESTDINALADEYLRLSYHGLRAKDNSFNATMKTDFDPSAGEISIIPQDIGRVLLNLYNNAFYAVTEKKKSGEAAFEPTVSVSTKKTDHKITITVKDNGNGIPKKIVDKIFQPFFTTKPTGQGTGLGLSLSYDIVKAHGGEIKTETNEGEGTTFILNVPFA